MTEVRNGPVYADVPPPGLNIVAQVLNLAQENGLTPYPVVSGLGEGTAIPRLLPATAAKDKAGKPLPAFCLSAPGTRAVLGDYYAGMLERYFSGVSPWFMIHLGAADACHCAACKKKAPDALVRDYLLWLLPFLSGKGVKQTILCDELPAKLGDAVFTAELAKQLGKLNLPQPPVLARPRDAAVPVVKKGAAAAGWIRWLAPECTPAHWVDSDKLSAIFAKLLPPAFGAGACGTLLETVWDTSCFEVVERYAAQAWQSADPRPAPRTPAELLSLRLAADAPAYLEAKAALIAALKPGSPGAALLNQPLFAGVMPRAGTGAFDLSGTMAALAGKDGKALREQLQKIAAAGVPATQTLAAVLDRENKPVDVEMVRLLACETARIGGIARALLGLLPVWEAAAAKKAGADTGKAVAAVHASIIESLTQIESRRNKLTAPLRLAELSPLLGLTEQLARELAGGAGKGAKAAPLTWSWSLPPPPA